MTKKRSTSRKQTPVKRISKRSGGVNVKAKKVSAEDVVGRDEINAGGDAFTGDNATKINTNVGTVIKDSDVRIEAPAPIATSLHQLPSPPIDFTGRAAELDELLNNIEGGAIITGLRGMGGIGKTALALVLADQLKDKYPDAQFYLDLRGASDKPMPPIEAMQHVIRGFHPTAKLPDDPNDIAVLYRSVLDGQRALLLMDNAKDAEQIKPLLPPASCLMLITSRQKFSVQGMRDPIDLNTLSLDDARELLIKIAPRLSGVIARSAEGMTKQSPLTVKEIATPPAAARNDAPMLAADVIAKLCGYLPLALQVSASTLAERIDLQPQGFIRRLSDTQQRLQLTGVEASLQLSYDLLTPELKQTFSQLSVYPASFDAAAEEAVCEDTDHTRLSELVRLSLVQYDETTQRYQLHDLVRLFVDKRFNDQERETAQYLHAEYYKNILRLSKELYKQGGDNTTRGLALFDMEWNNIKAGQKWATDHIQRLDAAQLCNDYPNAGADVLNLRLHPREHIRWLETALDAARKLKDRSGEGAHLGNLGIAYTDLGETRKAIDYLEQALIVDREIGDRRGEGSSFANLGLAYADLGETRKAIDYYEQALKVMQEISDKRGEASILGNLGVAYKNLDETRKAIEFYEQALIIDRESGDRRGEAKELMNIGNAHNILGEIPNAIQFHEKALTIFREIGDRRGEGDAICNLGNVYADLDESRKAIEFYEQAMIIAREISYRRGENTVMWNLSLAMDKLGERAKAIKLAEVSLKIHEEIEDPFADTVRKQLAEWKGEK